MHPTKTFLLSILAVCVSMSSRAQYKDIQYFGSYHYGFGNLTAKVDPSLSGPMLNEVKQLKSGTSQQVELGVYFNTVVWGSSTTTTRPTQPLLTKIWISTAMAF